MATMPTNYQNIPPEVLDAMLGLSEQDAEKKQLERQLYLGHMLGRQATEYQPKGGGNAWGGAAGALAQGMQGYMSGQAYGDYKTKDAAQMEKRRGQRKTYFDWQQSQQAPPAAKPLPPLENIPWTE